MHDHVYDVPAEWAERAWVDKAKYEYDVQAFAERPGRILGRARQTHRLVQALHQGQGHFLGLHNVSIKWYEDGVTNVAYNCVDRHLPKRANQVAIIWEGDNPNEFAPHHLRGTL